MNIRKASFGLMLPILLIIALFAAARMAVQREAEVSITSPSGLYLLQSVSLASWSSLVYVRVIDTRHPDFSFRTPVFDRQYTDMRLHEDEKTVGTYWIDFDKQHQSFEVGVPEWHDRWLNLLISNTPYQISES